MTNIFRRKLLARTALVAVGAALVTTPSQAVIDEIVVTVQKREQALIDVPMAVSAFGGETMKEFGIQQFDDLAGFVPGLEVQEQSPNNPSFVIRGITSDDTAPNIEPRVAIFQDGVPSSRASGSFFELHDIDRVEVVKGPQPTLFGRAALIGGINVLQARPSYEGYFVDGNVAFGRGEGTQQEYSLVANAPIIDDVMAFRFSGIYKKRQGYINNVSATGGDVNGAETLATRGSLRIDPSESVRINLIFNHQVDTPPGTGFKAGKFATLGTDASPFTDIAIENFNGFADGADLGVQRELMSFTAIASWDMNDSWSATATYGFRTYNAREVFDPDGTNYRILTAVSSDEGTQHSQELRINYTGEKWLDGFFGVSYIREKGNITVPLATDTGQGVPFLLDFLANGGAGTTEPFLPPSGQSYEEAFQTNNKSQAVDLFADAAFHATDKLDITAGIRFTADFKETSYQGGVTTPGGLAGSLVPSILPIGGILGTLTGALSSLTGQCIPGSPPDCTLLIPASRGGQLVTAEENYSGFAWRFNVAYRFTDDLNVWANYSRGRRPEVLTFNTPQDDPDTAADESTENDGYVIPVSLDAETVDSFEVGVFSYFFDNLVNVNASAYYYRYNNFQTSVIVGGQAAVNTINAGKASAYGLELAVVADPFEFLKVFLSYGYNHGRFADEDGDGKPQQFGGNRFRLSPDHSFAIGTTFGYETNFGTFSVTPTYTFRSKFFFDDDNDRPDLQGNNDNVQDELQDGVGVLDVTMRWNSSDANYTVELFGKNLLDEEYLLDAGNTGDSFGLATFIPAPPRLIGLRLTASLGY